MDRWKATIIVTDLIKLAVQNPELWVEFKKEYPVLIEELEKLTRTK